MGIDIFEEGGLSIYGGLHTASVTYADDVLLKLGIDGDIAQLLRSSLLGANTALDNVLIGTPVSQAIAANSYMLSNVTASGDLAFYINKGGASQMVLWADGSTGDTAILAASGQSVDIYIGGSKVFDLTNDGTKSTILGLSGDYWRIGDAFTTNHTLNSEDDLMVTGELEVDGNVFFDNTLAVLGAINTVDNQGVNFGTGLIARVTWSTSDANANMFATQLPDGGGTDVPVHLYGTATTAPRGTDFQTFDGVTQPVIVMVEKNGLYQTSTSGTQDGSDTDELTETGAFASSVVGDVIELISGTNITAGWYWITDVTNNDNVNLDRAFVTGGAASDIVYVVYHDFTMLSADGICTRITDGAPSDASVEIDRDGWLILDVGQANGRLYWRANNAWHHVDATAGLSMPADERVDKNGHRFELGDTVKLVVDVIHDDGTFHAMPEYGGRK